MSFEQMWAECERLQGEVDGLRKRLRETQANLAHEEGLHAATQMELGESRARLACLVSDLRAAEKKMASTIGRKGGQATGEAKRRGDSAHYKAMRAKVGKR